jgi:hypothetical protein
MMRILQVGDIVVGYIEYESLLREYVVTAIAEKAVKFGDGPDMWMTIENASKAVVCKVGHMSIHPILRYKVRKYGNGDVDAALALKTNPEKPREHLI